MPSVSQYVSVCYIEKKNYVQSSTGALLFLVFFPVDAPIPVPVPKGLSFFLSPVST